MPLSSAVSQVPSAQNNQYSKAAYFGMAVLNTFNSSKIYILFRIDHILGQKFDTYKKMQLIQSVASDYSVVKIRNLLQKGIWKTSHIWKLTFLNNTWVKESIRREIRNYF